MCDNAWHKYWRLQGAQMHVFVVIIADIPWEMAPWHVLIHKTIMHRQFFYLQIEILSSSAASRTLSAQQMLFSFGAGTRMRTELPLYTEQKMSYRTWIWIWDYNVSPPLERAKNSLVWCIGHKHTLTYMLPQAKNALVLKRPTIYTVSSLLRLYNDQDPFYVFSTIVTWGGERWIKTDE